MNSGEQRSQSEELESRRAHVEDIALIHSADVVVTRTCLKLKQEVRQLWNVSPPSAQ